jgi:hypothetical protein
MLLLLMLLVPPHLDGLNASSERKRNRLGRRRAGKPVLCW